MTTEHLFKNSEYFKTVDKLLNESKIAFSTQ
jgi:hypothetical protein